ncbi:surface lipoprotein assembly modifier [Primorskyibacter sp. S87]|uniref:surface lipoprotein assembly modifier n=1 Tax=Primorskyibacter sp. S87 TaxID=3415126 RepID=UPI003C7E9C20
MRKRCLRSWFGAAALAFFLISGAAAEEVRLDPEQMRQVAGLALQSGQPDRAYTYSEALLKRDPDDRIALLINAGAARSLGQYGHAKSSARRAWQLSETDAEKYAASLTMAQVLSSSGARTRAQWWLRRAVEHAPNEQLTNRAIRDFRYVRATNPWLTRISFAITPDSNINNGSSERSSFLNYRLSELLFGQQVEYQLDGAAVALSGIEYAFRLTTRYRFAQTETRAHDLVFTSDVRHYTLSSKSKELAPGVEGNDFAFASYTFGYGQRGINFNRQGEYRVYLDLGQSWYGGDEYARFIRLSAGQSYTFKSAERINFRLAGEHQKGITRSDSDTLRADFSYSRFLRNGMRLWTNLTGAYSKASLDVDEFQEVGLRAQLTLAKPVAGATVHLGLWLRNRQYDVTPHSRDGRREDKIQADLTMVFNQIDYYGFNPTMRVTASKTDSNISLYDAKRFGVNFGIQSAF